VRTRRRRVMRNGRRPGIRLTPNGGPQIRPLMDTIAWLSRPSTMRSVEERRPPARFTDRDPGRRRLRGRGTRIGLLLTALPRCSGAASGPGSRLMYPSLSQGTTSPRRRAYDFQLAQNGRRTCRTSRGPWHAPCLDAGATSPCKLKMGVLLGRRPGSSGVGGLTGRPQEPAQPHHVNRRLVSCGSGSAGGGGWSHIALGATQGGSIRLPAAWWRHRGLMADPTALGPALRRCCGL